MENGVIEYEGNDVSANLILEKKWSKKKSFQVFVETKIDPNQDDQKYLDILHNRQIPCEVHKEVYELHRCKCRICGSIYSLYFDHILSFSKERSSKVAFNIQC